MVANPATVYRYSYTAKSGARCRARVTIHLREEEDGFALLMLRCVGGAWPDYPQLTEADTKGTPVCKGVLLSLEEECEWCRANLEPEDGFGDS